MYIQKRILNHCSSTTHCIQWSSAGQILSAHTKAINRSTSQARQARPPRHSQSENSANGMYPTGDDVGYQNAMHPQAVTARAAGWCRLHILCVRRVGWVCRLSWPLGKLGGFSWPAMNGIDMDKGIGQGLGSGRIAASRAEGVSGTRCVIEERE